MHDNSLPSVDASKVDSSWRIGIVRSVWHGDCTSALAADAKARLIECGIAADNVRTIDAPGSFEIPLLCKKLIDGGFVDGIITLGVIVQGETHHAEIIAHESARAIMDLQMRSGIPIVYEILFVNNIADAKKRSIGKNGKGRLAADTVLHSLANVKQMQS